MKTKPVVKKKRKFPKKTQLSEKKLSREIEKAIDILDEETEARYEYAEKLLDEQDQKTRQGIESLVEVMQGMAGDPSARITVEGMDGAINVNIPRSIQERNFVWITARFLVRLLDMGIRFENFKIPKNMCADCGKKIKPKVVKKRG